MYCIVLDKLYCVVFYICVEGRDGEEYIYINFSEAEQEAVGTMHATESSAGCGVARLLRCRRLTVRGVCIGEIIECNIRGG